eukprot:819060-Amphidinium_carterae.1
MSSCKPSRAKHSFAGKPHLWRQRQCSGSKRSGPLAMKNERLRRRPLYAKTSCVLVPSKSMKDK